MHKTELTKLNQFSKGDNRVWYDSSKGEIDFGYSDGQEIEHRLKAILTQSKDLSCTSYELKSYISDWPTQYHLTPVRANLIRALNLSGVKRVLELGCGCGSITRYLGDFEHEDGSKLQVDSVEGSPIRADLAAERCRDLDNVTISTANFNQIEFPEDYYDLVLYVGVTEYAGKYSDRETDTEALQDLLALGKKAAIKECGIVMVAIENRTGMKYVQGANEDHYAKPYIGIHDYAQPAGIRTYTKHEWEEQIDIAGFSASEFIYPFPDYKIPTVFLGEDYVDENPYSFNHLETCRSRDYIEPYTQASKEALLWEAAAATKSLGQFANSFMILMTNDQSSIDQMSQNDFLHLPTYDRKLPFCMAIAKPKGKDSVDRSYIADDVVGREEIKDRIQHKQITNETFQQGSMLSVEWSRSLVSYRDLNVFEQFLKDYYQFLCEQQKSKKLSIDLLPSNIVVDAQSKQYHVVDEEWLVTEELEADYIYFRAILFFYMSYPDFVEQSVVKQRQLHTLEDLFRYAFAVVGASLGAEELLGFAQKNSDFQNAISSQPVSIDFQEVLAKIPSYTSLQWKQGEGVFKFDQSIKASGNGKYERETLSYILPADIRSVSGIQFSPATQTRAENNAFFRVYKVTLSAKNTSGEQRVLWSIDGEAELAQAAQLHGLKYENDGVGSGFYILTDNPNMSWDVDGSELEFDEHLACDIDVLYPLTEHGQELVKRSFDIVHLQSQIATMQASRAYKIGQKITQLAGQARRVAGLGKRTISKALYSVKPKPIVKLTLDKSHFQGQRLAVANDLSSPLVSIIIPFRDEPELLETCVDSVVKCAAHQNYEIIAVSNDSQQVGTQEMVASLTNKYPQFQCVEKNIEFNFSELVNYGVSQSKGEYVVLLNNDVRISSAGWISDLLSIAMIGNVATVGGRLDYDDGRVQHLGLHINAEKLPDHSFKGVQTNQPALAPLLGTPRYVSAVTGAMMMVSRSIWDELNGFDEVEFGVALNDADFCLRALEKGYKNIVDPLVKGFHVESHSRGYESTMGKVERFQTEQQAFIARHDDYVSKGDPYCVQ